MRIGVLALQGAFQEHIDALKRVDKSVDAVLVREPADMAGLDGLIIPGGESTTMRIVGSSCPDLFATLSEWVNAGNPTWGTCAGLILLASVNSDVALLKGLDIRVTRNFYGSQTHSFKSDVSLHGELGRQKQSFPGIFIRAPLIAEVLSDRVQVLGTLARDCDRHDGPQVVAVRQANVLGTTFHPELTKETMWHEYFIDMIRSTFFSLA